MNADLQSALPLIIPKAIAWAEGVAADVLRSGAPLTTSELLIANGVGVAHPELVRVAIVSQLPLPTDPLLQQAAASTGLLGPNMAGLTLGYAIFIRDEYESVRLLSHECRHVYQYETLGSIANFLPLYLKQIVDFGYQNSPLEIDAREHELRDEKWGQVHI